MLVKLDSVTYINIDSISSIIILENVINISMNNGKILNFICKNERELTEILIRLKLNYK